MARTSGGAGESNVRPRSASADDEVVAERAHRKELMIQQAEQRADEIRDDPHGFWLEEAMRDRRSGYGERLLRQEYDPILNDEDFADLMQIEPPEFDQDGDRATTEAEWEYQFEQEKRREAQEAADPHGYRFAQAESSRRDGSNEASLRRNFGCLGLTDEDFDMLMAIEPEPRERASEYWRKVEKKEREQAARQKADPHAYWLGEAEIARRGNAFTEEQLRSTYGRFGLTDQEFAALMTVDVSREDE